MIPAGNRPVIVAGFRVIPTEACPLLARSGSVTPGLIAVMAASFHVFDLAEIRCRLAAAR
jgi:hypothetical protein